MFVYSFGPSLFASGLRLTDPSPDDGQKFLGMQAGAADQGAVHAVATQEGSGVLRLDAAAVLDDQRLSRPFIEHLTEATPNDGVRLMSLLGGGFVSEIANCPHRFMSDGEAGQSVCRQFGQSPDELPLEHRFGLAGLALVQGLAAAEDHLEAGGQGKSYLLNDERIGFAQLMPALAVSEDHELAADIEEHRRADLAGKRALFSG